MRIGLVLDRFEPSRGGRERWTFAFAERLAARGHEVHVVARRLGEAALRLPVSLHRVACERSPLAFAEAARRALEPLALDIVHDMGTGWSCDVFQPHGGTWAAVNDRKLLFLPRWLRWLKRGIDRLLPRQRDFPQAHGPAVRRPRPGAGGVVAGRGGGFRPLPRHCARAGSHHLQRRGHRAFLAGALRRLPRGGPRAGWASARETVLALLVAHNFRLKGVATLLARDGAAGAASGCRCGWWSSAANGWTPGGSGPGGSAWPSG